MAVKCYNILGAAYADTLTKATGKTLTQLSEEIGYSPTFLKNIKASGRIRTGIADLIEAKYGISVAPYILPEKKEEPAPERVVYCKAEELATEISRIVYDAIIERFRKEVES